MTIPSHDPTPAGGATPTPAGDLPLVRELANELLPEIEAIADAMALRLHHEIAELREDDGGSLLNETRASCRSNVAQILHALARGESSDQLTAPFEAVVYARSYVRRQLGVAVLLRAYRVGQAYFIDVWAASLARRLEPGPAVAEALAATTTWTFDYVDRTCNQLVIEYATAQREWARTPDAIRTEAVRRILSGVARADQATEQLHGYPMRRRYHVGLMIWVSDYDGAAAVRQLERAAADAAGAVGVRDPLIVHPGGAELWAWCPLLETPGTAALAALGSLTLHESVRIAAGRPRTELEGFRRTHVEARAAARVAALAGARSQAVTFYKDVELVALLSADIERARAFVHDELRGLAEPGGTAARLRQTLLVLMEEGMSNSHAAERLFVHHNTVVYRTARAQELLGRKPTERRFELAAALILAETLGDAVLKPESGGS